MSATVPTLIRGAAVLISVQGAEGVRYIPLAPLSTMAVYVIRRIVLLVLGLWDAFWT